MAGGAGRALVLSGGRCCGSVSDFARGQVSHRKALFVSGRACLAKPWQGQLPRHLVACALALGYLKPDRDFSSTTGKGLRTGGR